jgi:hypothetical protein
LNGGLLRASRDPGLLFLNKAIPVALYGYKGAVMNRPVVMTVVCSIFPVFFLTAHACAERYINQEYAFSMDLPDGWTPRAPRVREESVYAEVNRSRTASDEVPGISIMVSKFLEKGQGNTEETGYLIGNTEGLLLEWRSRGGTWEVLEKAHVVKVGNLTGVRMFLDYATVPLGDGKTVLKNIKLVFYAFQLSDKTKTVSISFYAHADERGDEELREMEPLIETVAFSSGER